tara:strand:+ start:155 stop:787 length:633 start_codon:yes stop_codon:yes gene_type:complete
MPQTQDDKREKAQIELFDLLETKGRSNKYLHDATLNLNGRVYHIELKTSDTEKGVVSTSRVVNLEKLEEYENLWWIFSKYYKNDQVSRGFDFTGEHYVLHGSALKPWLEKQRSRIQKGSTIYAGLDDWYHLKNNVQEGFPQDVLNRLEYSFKKYGASLNDPRINWSDVVKYGRKIDPERPVHHLREILLDMGNKNTQDNKPTQGILFVYK